ncbi:MAG TPA: hypothetical protein VK629_01305 [Steroidobacteraceae bacterium]|nr:hypothetical protein [Steroidobacteraceae bacterium]
MANWLKKVFGGSPSTKHLAMVVQDERPQSIEIEGSEPFDIVTHLYGHEGLPIPDWNAIGRWVDSLQESQQQKAWQRCVQAWLLHMRDALGEPYQLIQSQRALLITPFEARSSASMALFVERTLRAVLKTLPDIAAAEDDWQPILFVFADQHRYYDYVSHAYPDHGEYGFSAGMYLRVGPGHFVTSLAELPSMERIIAHEMTHACLAHLDIPLWLNEGLAMNTEFRLVGAAPPQFGPREMHARHVEFWNPDHIQEFWNGRAFQRSDEGLMLAYDLAKILVHNMANDWKSFAAFANDASYEDGGDRAARQHLRLDLGRSVASLFDGESPSDWAPNMEAMKTAAKEPANFLTPH